MKKFTLSVVAVLAMSAFAVAGGDIEPVVEPVVVVDAWSGPYVGIQAGYVWGDADLFSFSDGEPGYAIDDMEVNGGIGGIYAGYNWLLDNNVLLGVEGEYNWVSADDSVSFGNVEWGWGADVKQDWDASLRLRSGVVVGDYLPYVTAGVAWAGVEVHGWRSNGVVSNHDETLTGWTVGAGVEKKINENLTARIQYRYTDYGDESWDIPDGDYNEGKVTYNANMLTVGVSYRF